MDNTRSAESSVQQSTTARIFACHGIVDCRDEGLVAHRNMMDRAAFEKHLTHRTTPYVEMMEGIGDHGDVLTIDDATVAAYDAAMLAKRYNHSVTLFINPLNIVASLKHYFILLSEVLDQTQKATIHCDNHTFLLNSFHNKLVFRQYVKQHLLAVGSESDRNALISDLASRLEVTHIKQSPSMQTLDLASLKRLAQAGVNIENHGWTHSVATTPSDITRAKSWISDNLGVNSELYAVPFGKVAPSFPNNDKSVKLWLLCDGSRAPGYVADRIFNRTNLVIR